MKEPGIGRRETILGSRASRDRIRESGIGRQMVLCALSFVPLFLCLVGCRKVVGPTDIHVQDPMRHYFPVIMGHDVQQNWLLFNDGNSPLVISAIQPDCSDIEFAVAPPKTLLPGDSIMLCTTYHAGKIIGHATHNIRIFGNINPDGVYTMTFDIHIIRPSVDHSDYEELHTAQQPGYERLVDGTMGEKGYYQ